MWILGVDCQPLGEDAIRHSSAWKPRRNSEFWATFWMKEVNLVPASVESGQGHQLESVEEKDGSKGSSSRGYTTCLWLGCLLEMIWTGEEN